MIRHPANVPITIPQVFLAPILSILGIPGPPDIAIRWSGHIACVEIVTSAY